MLITLQGPVLSGHKKLIADKLTEEEAERHVKGEAKKEKKMVISYFNLVDLSIIPTSMY